MNFITNISTQMVLAIYFTAMDSNPFQNERLSIKNLLFTKAIPNYILPVPTEGRPIFSCTDCGDKFIIKSSYEHHIRRKSLKITYFCRHCNAGKIFFNRCGLLSHIRSHAFKTATISISDLTIEPLPLSFYKHYSQKNYENDTALIQETPSINQDDKKVENETQPITCFDCKNNIFCSGIAYKDRAKHYTQYTSILYSCPICLLTLTTKCALNAHLRIHLREPPYYCPDCGINLTKKAIVYPFTHDCESFRMMRVTTKLKCLANNCNKVFHPSESNQHLRTNHLKHVYKCPACSVACYKLDNMQKHMKTFHMKKFKSIDWRKLKYIEFLQCEMCPGRLVIPAQMDKHLKSHEHCIDNVYPCWTCGATFKLAKSLLEHQEFKHPKNYKEKMLGKISQDTNPAISLIKSRSLKLASEKCDKCFGHFVSQRRTNLLCKCKTHPTPKIMCNFCQMKITQDWNIIKKHYAIHHKEHVCLDVKILLKKICIEQSKKAIICSKKRQESRRNIKNNNNTPENNNKNTFNLDYKFVCSKCGQGYETKDNLEKHIVEHRDPFMAYQCLECGESYIAKRSFSTHLLLKHGINDVNNYIDEKKCYSEDSVHLQKPNNVDQNEPVRENQCNICREQFSNSADYKKHFRVHGMAFLMKNTCKPSNPENV